MNASVSCKICSPIYMHSIPNILWQANLFKSAWLVLKNIFLDKAKDIKTLVSLEALWLTA